MRPVHAARGCVPVGIGRASFLEGGDSMPLVRDSAQRPSRRSLCTGERRSTLPILTICLSLATAIALLGAGAALTDAGVAAPRAGPAATNAQIVRDFYAAINDAIHTGNAGTLDTIVAPAVAWCLPCPGQPPTRDGLKRYLADLHRTAPAARLSVESVTAGFPDTVTARIRVSGYPMVGEPVPWGPVDTFRLAGGLIAERRSGPDGIALVEPLLGARLDALPPAVTGVTMARLAFPVGSGVAGLLSAGPTLLVVESGALTMQIASGGRILRAGGDETAAANGMGITGILHQGDAAIIPPGVRHALHQHGTAPAAAVGATLVFVDNGRDHLPRRGPELAPFFPPEMTDPTSPPLPAVRHLAGGAVDTWPAGPVTIALGRVILGPGARVVPAAGEAILFAVEAGTLGVGEDRTVAAGADSMQPMEPVREFRNAGGGLLVLLVLTVSPAALEYPTGS